MMISHLLPFRDLPLKEDWYLESSSYAENAVVSLTGRKSFERKLHDVVLLRKKVIESGNDR